MPADIQHVVVLMLENRSFDHLFGLYAPAEGLGSGDYSNLLRPLEDESATNVRIHAKGGAPWAIDKGLGPSHSLNGTTLQLFGSKEGPTSTAPRNSGFVASYASALRSDNVRPKMGDVAKVMLSFEHQRLPAISKLAEEFVLCDHWFAEVPGPTQPNRLYVHAGTSAGYAHNDWAHVFDFDTVYNRLEERQKTWATYFSDDNEVAKFSKVNDRTESFRVFEDKFVADAKAGQLPNYTFVIPRFAASGAGEPVNSMHAPDDIRPGDTLIADVYEALRANEEAWAKTLLIVTFDEHGGFFDHVEPAATVNPDGINSPAPGDPASFAPKFDFSRLGLRVPTLLISPLLPKGKVVSTAYQHTSIIATLRELWGLGPLTKRDAAAKSFAGLLGDQPRDTPKHLPRAQEHEGVFAALALAPAHLEHPSNAPLDELQQELAKGWHALLRSTGSVQGVSSEQPVPETQGDAHEFLKTSVLAYVRHRNLSRGAGRK